MRTTAEVLVDITSLVSPFDLSEQLLLPLNLEDHLTMNIFDVKVFSSYNQSSLVPSHLEIVQSVVPSPKRVLAQTIVVSSSRLLETINCIRLLSGEVRHQFVGVIMKRGPSSSHLGLLTF